MIKFIPEKYVVECTVDMPIRWNLDDDSKYRQRCYSAAQKAMDSTQEYDSYFLNLAIGYGGREEIVQAIKKIAVDVKKGALDIESIDTNIMPSYLYTSDLPDPDFVLRTSGEERLSNFLLWQLAYSELYFSDVYWPAFKKTDFLKAIRSYQQRQRRYGG